jgi:hypothetical protein
MEILVFSECRERKRSRVKGEKVDVFRDYIIQCGYDVGGCSPGVVHIGLDIAAVQGSDNANRSMALVSIKIHEINQSPTANGQNSSIRFAE